MKHTQRKPCGNCPFLKSAPLAHWHPDHYLQLERIERVQADPVRSTVFGCHKFGRLPDAEQELCIGWVLNQRENGMPSMALRLHLIHQPDSREQVNEAECDEPMWETVRELVAANLLRDTELHPERYGLGSEEE